MGVGLLPTLDQALSTLIGDLDDRGLLNETLVVVMGEFGRTPKLNTRGGRDHWPGVLQRGHGRGGVREGKYSAKATAPANDLSSNRSRLLILPIRSLPR